MFKLGEYYEEEAKPIMKYLKDAGIKAELRTYLSAVSESSDYIEGKLSELRGEISDIEDYERFLSAIRATFAKGATPDDFKELFFSELDPSWMDKKEKFNEIFGNRAEDSSEDCECCAECCEPQDENQEENDLEDFAKFIVAFDFALNVISRNEIESAEVAEGRLEDPILRIRIDGQAYEGDMPIKQTISVDLENISEIYVDEFSTPLFDELDEDFQESYPDEFLGLMALGTLIKDLAEEPSPGKIDMPTFLERLNLEMERDGDILDVDGTKTANEIARILEKNDVIKHKGDTIKWRS
jgi:hypothetical protein